MEEVISRLLNSEEACVRYSVRRNVLADDPDSSDMKALREEIRGSQRVVNLLSERDEDGFISTHPYGKFDGAHWVLSMLAEIWYPVGDTSLIPLREQTYQWLLPRPVLEFEGRVRTCASMQGNLIFSLLRLGLADERTDELVQRLLKWQWPDGGWNCDRQPQASRSSFMESLIPLRALTLYAEITGSEAARRAAEQAADIFLKREMYKRQSDGSIMDQNFILLHFPCYWHYDILFGLKVMAEAGFIRDSRCVSALDLLESRRLVDGGFLADRKYYQVTDKPVSQRSLVNWGGTSKHKMNEFITADALFVLKAAGRIS